MKKGIFIALEGGEGAGKSTQIGKMREHLPALFPDREFVFSREPGGSPFAEKIREIIVGDEAKDADGRTMIGLLMASRADHVANLIRPAIDTGKVVVSDRYYGSSYAYQVVAQENPEVEEVFWAYAKLMEEPDLTIFYDLDPQIALERVNNRNEKKSHFDARKLDFHSRIHEGYEQFFRKSPKGLVRVSAERSPEEVWEDTLTALKEVLGRG